MSSVARDCPRYVGCCEVFDEIAKGGYATVYLGRWLGVGGFTRAVAIKRLHRQFVSSSKVVTMFANEARIVARIKHPHVLSTIDLVSHDDELFIIMDYIEGLSVSNLLLLAHRNQQEIPAAVAVKLMLGVLEGLQAAHDAKDASGKSMHLVHRDISPENILVGVDGYPRILDFGVAKAVGMVSTTIEGEIKGKLAYMAPEQLGGRQVSRATDIFAASIVLWELLSQRRLFKARTVAATAQSVMTKSVLPPSTYRPKLSEKVDAVVLRGLERDWKKRWRSANEFAFSLERSTRVASHREVIQWLKKLGKDELLRRATIVRDMELTPVNADRVALLRRPVSRTAEPTPTMAAHAMGEEVGPSPSSPRGPLESSPGELAHARESSPAKSPVARGPYGANMVPDARVSDRTFTRDATNSEITGSTVRELARRPLSSGLAAVLFAFCTLLIVFSVSWQRTSEQGGGGSVRLGSYGPREAARQPRSGNGDGVHSEALHLARPEKVVVMAGVAALSATSVASVAPSMDVLVTPPRRAAKHQGGKARSRSVARRKNLRDRTKSRPTGTNPSDRRSKRKVKPMPWAY